MYVCVYRRRYYYYVLIFWGRCVEQQVISEGPQTFTAILSMNLVRLQAHQKVV